MYSLYVNIKEWDKLPKEYQAAIEAASAEANIDMMAKYDFKNLDALERLVKNGVKLHAFSDRDDEGRAEGGRTSSTRRRPARTRRGRRSTSRGRNSAARVPVAPRGGVHATRTSRTTTRSASSGLDRSRDAGCTGLPHCGCSSSRSSSRARILGLVGAASAGALASPARRAPAGSPAPRSAAAARRRPMPLIAPAAFEMLPVTMPGKAMTIATISTWMHDERHRAPVDVRWSSRSSAPRCAGRRARSRTAGAGTRSACSPRAARRTRRGRCRASARPA